MFREVTEDQPILNEYVLIEKNGFITISQWLGDRFDIQPTSNLPWFNKYERIRSNDPPNRWMPLPEVANA
jgi:hypothetical protein